MQAVTTIGLSIAKSVFQVHDANVIRVFRFMRGCPKDAPPGSGTPACCQARPESGRSPREPTAEVEPSDAAPTIGL